MLRYSSSAAGEHDVSFTTSTNVEGESYEEPRVFLSGSDGELTIEEAIELAKALILAAANVQATVKR